MMEPYTVMGERAYTVLYFWEAVVDRNPFRILDELQNHMSQTITALFSFSFFFYPNLLHRFLDPVTCARKPVQPPL